MCIVKRMIALLLLIILQTNLGAKNISPYAIAGIVSNHVNTLIDSVVQIPAPNEVCSRSIAHNNIAPSLRINIENFTGNKQGKTNHLHWETTTAINIDHCAIEKSTNGNDYKEIGKVLAGKSSINYYYTDATPAEGINYYRLKIVDRNGNATFSKEIVLNVENEMVAIASVYPNPFNETILLNVTLLKTLPVKICLYDANGSLCFHTTYKANRGSNKIAINGLAKLSAGTYIIEILIGKKVFQQMILKEKK